MLAIVATTLLALPPVSASADGNIIQISSNRTSSLKIAKGKPKTIKTSVPFYQIVIGDPEIANVNPLTDRSFYVLGNNLGTTGIALFDENKQLVGSVDIEVTLDTDRLASTIRDTVPGADIEVKSANGRLVLSGSANDALAAEKATKIASEFSGEEKVINSVKISSSQQVQLNVRFVEINRQAGQELGTKIAASYITGGGGFTFNSNPAASTSPPAATLLGGLLSGNFAIDVALKALEDRGIARSLAEPNLIARSGETASFLAGGEFPIPVAEENNQITVDYKKYGVSLDFTPTVLNDGLISLEIQPEVSSVDTSASYNIGNISIPGFIVRRAHTSVDLKSGQSFMIAGLLQTQNNLNAQQIPGLGRIPVLGALFSSKAYQRRETDLVIIITPYLVKPMDPTKKPRTPADGTYPASAADYFLGGVEETRARGRGALAYASGVTTGGPVATSGHFLDLPKE
ncbi:type II and III secretion system protein family protein [Mesorhizobium sp. BAC0120]|uniref:type II and III secretion system protein family protein n=1 Tax=Mesorhizobium sp. BAC0120 TaxID=3090670 RepID=UPI00298C726C|nr:type II and III secretion system protein family protein [Mesorhizobium sp. BAC0120]MDW6022733.1 type II and III secretion system protein family protein [Mesorhizobium sp. BAC0120]